MATWKSDIPKLLKKERAELSALVRRAAFSIDARAKILAPVDTGFLRNSIHVEMIDDLNARVIVGAEYALYVELGTSRMRAQPFFVPAIDQTVQEFGGRLKKVIE